MSSPTSVDKPYFPSLVLWGLIYLVLVYISLILNDPQSRVAMVWFPAGAAVSACLSLPRRFWPLLYLMLFILQTTLDTVMRHSLETSLVIALISLSGNFTVAWAVRYFGRGRDDFRKVCTWLISTFVVSALIAFPGAGWLAVRHELPFFTTATLLWTASVSGNLVATTVLTGLSWELTRLTPRQVMLSFSGITLVALSAAYVFSMPPGAKESAGLIYGLACIPILLAVAVPLAAGSQAGALAFLALCIIVIFFSWQQRGPFFIQGLASGEPLLLAQCYLSGTAVLMIFIRLQLRLSDTRNRHQYEEDKISKTAFRIDTASGRLEWDPHGTPDLHQATAQLPDRETLLRSVDADLRQQLIARWERVVAGKPVSDELIFRVTLPDGVHLTVCEQHLFYLPGTPGGFIVGYWSIITGPGPFRRVEDD